MDLIDDESEVNIKSKTTYDLTKELKRVADSMLNTTDNPYHFISHHIDSYNSFFKERIFEIFKKTKEIVILFDGEHPEDNFCEIYLGGKDRESIYIENPIVDGERLLTPNEARLKNLTYAMNIYCDVCIEFTFNNSSEEEKKAYIKNLSDSLSIMNIELNIEKIKSDYETKRKFFIPLKKIRLCSFPIMVQSDFCFLSALSRDARFQMGECRNDMGGYFIIGGKEKTVVCQEDIGNNIIIVEHLNPSAIDSGNLVILDEYPEKTEKKKKNIKQEYRVKIRSVSENPDKQVSTFVIDFIEKTQKMEVFIPIIKDRNKKPIPIPLTVLFRALGVITDKEIVQICMLDLEKYSSILHLFKNSLLDKDAEEVYTQYEAIQYLKERVRYKTESHVYHILMENFLPHIGENNFRSKAYFVGYMVNQLIKTKAGLQSPTDRDHFRYKRIFTTGMLIDELFRGYLIQYTRFVKRLIDTQIVYEKAKLSNISATFDKSSFLSFILFNAEKVLKNDVMEKGIHKAFHGNWGASQFLKRVGIVQQLNRLSFNSYISHLRKTNIDIDASLKLVGPRLLHSSQSFYFDPFDSPDGANVGIHKHLSVSTKISTGYSRNDFIKWLQNPNSLFLFESIDRCDIKDLNRNTRIFINGFFAGVLKNTTTTEIPVLPPFSIQCLEYMKNARRKNLLPSIYTSFYFDFRENIITVYTDEGRACRPLFYRDEWLLDTQTKDSIITNKANIMSLRHISQNKENRWNDYIYGSEEENRKAIIDMIDPSESENALIAMDQETINAHFNQNKYTHMEIEKNFMFGIMCNQIMFPEFNNAPRNVFSCGQTKQATSFYSTNFPLRMDKSAIVLNYAQVPIVKTEYLQLLCNEENMYGINAMVAISCYSGYNVEDAVLINEGAIQRGLFSTTYYNTYTFKESEKITQDKHIITQFSNHLSSRKNTHDYTNIDDYGIIKEGSPVNEQTILIQTITYDNKNPTNNDYKKDDSIGVKKGQSGIVDKVYISNDAIGQRTVKVRIAERRQPGIGDKMASRAGQKGTIGIIIPERDMPFTADGLKPDIIVNPHAIPSRMTVCHLLETMFGKLALENGVFCNSTAFHNEAKCIENIGKALQDTGFESYGNEVFYNGRNGQQMEMSLFFGPTYYMRLKHMVKDKINFRPEIGPIDQLTRQPLQGRAADGGLRLGEMERDALISYGIENFVHESFVDRADKYYMAVCNTTGLVYVYNRKSNRVFSLYADGPHQFQKDHDGKEQIIPSRYFDHSSFSIIKIPYAFKLLLQEMQMAGVQIRLITEKTIRPYISYKKEYSIDIDSNPNITPEEVVLSINKKIQEHNEKHCKETLIIPETTIREFYEKMHIDDTKTSNKLNHYNEPHIAPITVLDIEEEWNEENEIAKDQERKRKREDDNDDEEEWNEENEIQNKNSAEDKGKKRKREDDNDDEEEEWNEENEIAKDQGKKRKRDDNNNDDDNNNNNNNNNDDENNDDENNDDENNDDENNDNDNDDNNQEKIQNSGGAGRNKTKKKIKPVSQSHFVTKKKLIKSDNNEEINLHIEEDENDNRSDHLFFIENEIPTIQSVPGKVLSSSKHPEIGDLVLKRKISTSGILLDKTDDAVYYVSCITNNDGYIWITLLPFNLNDNKVINNSTPIVKSPEELILFRRNQIAQQDSMIYPSPLVHSAPSNITIQNMPTLSTIPSTTALSPVSAVDKKQEEVLSLTSIDSIDSNHEHHKRNNVVVNKLE